MKEFLAWITGILVFTVFVMTLGWFVQGNDFFMYKFWAPRYENARRNTYTHTQSYRQGSVQRLNRLCTEYRDSDDSHKPMIRDVINQEFSEWSVNDVPDYLQGCLSNSRN